MSINELIYEANYNPDARFTSKDEDLVANGKTYPSLKKLYIAFGDPIDANFARSIIGNLADWVSLLSSERWGPVIRNWKYELELKIKADALQTIIGIAKDDHDKNSYAASKFLVEGGWSNELKATGKAVGRPKKEVEDTSVEEIKTMTVKVRDDFARLINVN